MTTKPRRPPPGAPSTPTRAQDASTRCRRIGRGGGRRLPHLSAWRRLRRNPVFLIGLAITVGVHRARAGGAVAGPLGPGRTPAPGRRRPESNRYPAPSPATRWAPTTRAATSCRACWSGAGRPSWSGVLATFFGLIGGLVLGTLAGALAGWVDSLVMRIVDVMLSIPSLLLAFTLAALATKPSQWTLIVAISIVQVPIFARLLRGSMLAQRASDHVLAARSLGVKPHAIVFRHMLPNALGPVIVQATLVLAVAIIDAAALSFLGLGNPDDRRPEWGQMLGKAQPLPRRGAAPGVLPGRRPSSSSRSASR